MWWVLREAERWPEWWRGVQRVTVLAPDERYRIAWRSRVPYELEFDFEVVDLDEPRCDARGRERRAGRHGPLAPVRAGWRDRRDSTSGTFETTKRWMNVLAPLARPVFDYNHDVVMRWGGEGLARRLDCNLLAAG